MTELYELSLKELSTKIQGKEVSVEEVVKDSFNRIKDTESQIDAFITLNEEKSLEIAKELDEKGPTSDKPLAGVPIGIKDNIVTKDLLTTAASKMLYNFNPPYDATVMTKVYEAGMIPVGKLNMDEFAMGSSTETSYFKKTKNAWSDKKVPGGSSGGSAASVAASQIPVSLGSDTGGSIRQPASYNGIVGLKPTYGRISRYGLIAFASSLDQIGPMTRTVEDNAMVLGALSGHDVHDSTSAKREVPDFTSLIGKDIKGMKIGVPKEFMGEGVDPAVRASIEESIETFRKLGATVEEVSLPHSKYGVQVYYIIASSEASSNLQRFDGIRYGYRSEDITNLEDVYVKSRSEGFGDEVKRRIMLGTFSLSSGFYDAHFKKAGQVRTLIIEDFKKVFSEYDLILGPVSPTIAHDFGTDKDNPVTAYMRDILTIPVNLAGLPGMSLPCGFSEGMPIGLQLIGNYFEEEKMYQAAHAFESATEFHKKKPVILGGNA
ncbi:Asp-tRNA(Asn)/Glu-tRNA(Gln) amidotransferase subunit GatA [Vagococcus carniphilus]|uniref:Asp-tRNA(Asn)/Glu-tRNA(Gln) amidotransferase subunit GatA n=1 Tax=Vagococcus carniphilus TaxID=218144 RepID=UPI002891A0F2|nr:Asp-tRNA(Asn)/Glu-tRNA(Gln) amidotransferase subunit GatA [Vagococcus carniphilus]MDT2814749.1 Asp-tRNA(Asn)/Glu-tRNA(Gln) amidotransferase subunit GatA [Vagococcus carniphilus]MDT2831517.1 Asp-tRNA(Asn)/Glu-tRNA(Gln) amidotransferase subunit GatA [Vagococcus carniphilus]MDT2840239.1 Asp-tRNA(Asn)/Glu-tRNA(Gln) amidotransferase subunit GatA [Vagococcus carniphilus]MDT2854938.1 Asp-tRNA(Asn)/Glu-tRNA(Gln) amidotransferase subunit GatA [Vagococcus carniphilus]MDT2864852.1 Asp-tRNA(Asn)/Glu-tR